MRPRATGTFALYLLLVLTSLLDAAGHDLLCELGDQTLPRLVDHVAGVEGRAPSPGPDIAPGAPQPEHEGPCCLLSGQRISLGPSQTAWHSFLVAQALRAPDGGQPFRQLPASHTSRGPPAS